MALGQAWDDHRDRLGALPEDPKVAGEDEGMEDRARGGHVARHWRSSVCLPAPVCITKGLTQGLPEDSPRSTFPRSILRHHKVV